MTKDMKKGQTKIETAPIHMKRAPVTVSRSVARRIKNEWKRAKKGGDKRSLRAYAATTDGGPGWLANKKVG